MKVGLIRRGFSPTGGAEAYLLRLARALKSAGHGMNLFSTTTPGWQGQAEVFDEVTAVAGRTPRQFSESLSTLQPDLRQRCDVIFSLERVATCDVYRAGDGVHAAWLKHRAAVEPFWQPLVRQWNPKHRQLIELEHALMTQPGLHAVIANSQFVRREILDFYGIDPEKVHVVYNGLPEDRFGFAPELRERKRAELALSPSTVTVLFTGSGWDRKGLRWAISAVEQAADAAAMQGLELRLLVAGKGPEKRFRNRFVTFLGPRRDVTELLQAADIFLLPTLYDPFSNATLEALAAGLPVITTRANGVAEILQEGTTGEIIDHTTDVAAQVHALKSWLDPDRRTGQREVIIQSARPFTIERNVTDTLAILEAARRK